MLEASNEIVLNPVSCRQGNYCKFYERRSLFVSYIAEAIGGRIQRNQALSVTAIIHPDLKLDKAPSLGGSLFNSKYTPARIVASM
jgi:hypothetical protein